MNIIQEDEIYQYQSLIIPPHQRTLKFRNESKLVKIPKSIVLVYYYKKTKCIDDGFVFDFELNYKINFGNQICTNRKTFKNINEYISWYWNSKFKEDCGKHTKITIDWFRKCYFLCHSLAKFYQPNKLESWKKLDQEHIQNCRICKELK